MKNHKNDFIRLEQIPLMTDIISMQPLEINLLRFGDLIVDEKDVNQVIHAKLKYLFNKDVANKFFDENAETIPIDFNSMLEKVINELKKPKYKHYNINTPEQNPNIILAKESFENGSIDEKILGFSVLNPYFTEVIIEHMINEDKGISLKSLLKEPLEYKLNDKTINYLASLIKKSDAIKFRIGEDEEKGLKAANLKYVWDFLIISKYHKKDHIYNKYITDFKKNFWISTALYLDKQLKNTAFNTHIQDIKYALISKAQEINSSKNYILEEQISL